MFKNLLTDTEFETIRTPDSDLNRIQDNLQQIYQFIGQNMQKNLGIITLSPAPSINQDDLDQIADKPIYIQQFEPQTERQNRVSYCHYHKSYFERPIFIGVARGFENGIVKISTLYHESPALYLGGILKLESESDYEVIGLFDGVGLIRASRKSDQ